ncbi:MAG: hypothetical protein EOP88_16795 [Verrucomicrobiaceae bacterium]|nr:MAG: hypothetical protein EOP88_16795 [Verrucomicrobiaceae bacterium]
MVIRKGTTFVLLGCALLSASCVPPKATVVEAAAPAQKKVEKAPEPIAQEEIPLPSGEDYGLRMPSNMLELPSDSDFRATNPTAKPGDAGAVISRPPTDPPSRVKPKEEP